MPKRVFWPVALVIMGLILIASNMGYLPRMFWNLWPLMLIIIGLAGLLISDKEEWDTPKKKIVKKSSKKQKSARKSTRRKSGKK